MYWRGPHRGSKTNAVFFFLQGLHKKAKYRFVRQIRLVGMMLIVFVKESLQRVVSEVVAESIGTGLMGKFIQYRFPVV